MEKLRVLDFVSHGSLYAWMPNAGLQPATDVVGGGLCRLHSLDGDMFPAPRTHRLWAALTAAKAQEGAVPLTHFGTSVARNGFQQLGHFLDVSGANLRTLRLDLRAISFLRQHNTINVFRSSGLSVSPCKSLHMLAIHLDVTWRSTGSDNLSVFAALLCTAAPNTALERITITLDNLRAESLTMTGAPEALDTLDRCMANFPRLQRVDWQLSPSMRHAHLPVDIAGTSPLLHLLEQRLPRLMRREGLRVTWTVLSRR
ncbi:hypothetical protein PsYK624_122810 [Phanerochaete sordida]|uniref:Uncharacterized protein n=1 Tax=Phanerochaete sordida TaxID=48140 RepID=A0A9P3LIF1_9APHY|nr:hypothetical protein PsYK624_122810 [Phanerochaete sordida]